MSSKPSVESIMYLSYARFFPAALLAVVGCGHSSATPASSDDASTEDSGVDAGVVESGVDTGAEDASTGAGAADISGSVKGEGMAAAGAVAGVAGGYIFVFTVLSTQHTVASISSFPDACGNSDVVGKILYFDLFDNPSKSVSLVTAPGDFPIWAPSLQGGSIPTSPVSVVTFASTAPDGSGGGELAQSGTVHVTAISSTRLAVTFDVTFVDGHFTGSLDAPICPTWSRGSSIPTVGPSTP